MTWASKFNSSILGSQNKYVDLDRSIKKLRSPKARWVWPFFFHLLVFLIANQRLRLMQMYLIFCFAYLFCFIFHLSFCIIYVDLLYFVFLYELSNFTVADLLLRFMNNTADLGLFLSAGRFGKFS